MRTITSQTSNHQTKNREAFKKPIWQHDYENGSVFPVIKLIFQIILLAIGMGAAIRFFYQLFDLVPN